MMCGTLIKLMNINTRLLLPYFPNSQTPAFCCYCFSEQKLFEGTIGDEAIERPSTIPLDYCKSPFTVCTYISSDSAANAC